MTQKAHLFIVNSDLKITQMRQLSAKLPKSDKADSSFLFVELIP